MPCPEMEKRKEKGRETLVQGAHPSFGRKRSNHEMSSKSKTRQSSCRKDPKREHSHLTMIFEPPGLSETGRNSSAGRSSSSLESRCFACGGGDVYAHRSTKRGPKHTCKLRSLSTFFRAIGVGALTLQMPPCRGPVRRVHSRCQY